MKTRISNMLGIKYPILQGGMAWISDCHLAAAVSSAGGIADARGIAAAYMLGASGVQMGSRFICTKECAAHKDYKAAVLKAKDSSTVVTGVSVGKPVRALENPMTEKYIQLEREGVSFEHLEALTFGSLKKAAVEGNVAEGSVMAGQISGIIKDEPSCNELINRLVAETDTLIGGKGFYE